MRRKQMLWEINNFTGDLRKLLVAQLSVVLWRGHEEAMEQQTGG
jgi:CYTH domain-containing protein